MRTQTQFAVANPDAPRPLRALHSLREKHVRTLAGTLTQLPGIWSLERHEGCDGDLTLMLMPRQADRANLVVSLEADGFHLTANQDDDYRDLGCFGALDELLAMVQANVRGGRLGPDDVGTHLRRAGTACAPALKLPIGPIRSLRRPAGVLRAAPARSGWSPLGAYSRVPRRC